jgi:transcriptional regulator with XRE-family HTH domain
MKNLEDIRRTKVFAAMQNENLTFGSLLRTIRNVMGLTLSVVCEDTGISTQTMRFLEGDGFTHEPKEEVIKKLSTYYGIPYDYIKYKIETRLKDVYDLRRRKAVD